MPYLMTLDGPPKRSWFRRMVGLRGQSLGDHGRPSRNVWRDDALPMLDARHSTIVPIRAVHSIVGHGTALPGMGDTPTLPQLVGPTSWVDMFTGSPLLIVAGIAAGIFLASRRK